MRFSKYYSKLSYPVFTTIRQNKGYYKEGQIINITTPKSKFSAEIVAIRYIKLNDITDTIAKYDADSSKKYLKELMCKFYKDKANDLILITLMKK
jgi:hypothetical protein